MTTVTFEPVIKFHIWITYEKKADPYFFFLSELSTILILELCHIEKILWVGFLERYLSYKIETWSADEG